METKPSLYLPYTFETHDRVMYILYEDSTPVWEMRCSLFGLSDAKRCIDSLIDQLNRSYYAGIKWAKTNNILMTYPDLFSITPFTTTILDRVVYRKYAVKFNGELFMKSNDDEHMKSYAHLFNTAYREGIHSVYMDRLT